MAQRRARRSRRLPEGKHAGRKGARPGSRLAGVPGRCEVLVSLIAAIVAALLYGVASVMQAIAVRAATGKRPYCSTFAIFRK